MQTCTVPIYTQPSLGLLSERLFPLVIIRRPQWQQQSLISHRASQEQHDPLWYQTPDMGLEGLVATIRSVEKLQAALVNELMKKRREESELGHRLKENENCEYL